MPKVGTPLADRLKLLNTKFELSEWFYSGATIMQTSKKWSKSDKNNVYFLLATNVKAQLSMNKYSYPS